MTIEEINDTLDRAKRYLGYINHAEEWYTNREGLDLLNSDRDLIKKDIWSLERNKIMKSGNATQMNDHMSKLDLINQESLKKGFFPIKMQAK